MWLSCTCLEPSDQCGRRSVGKQVWGLVAGRAADMVVGSSPWIVVVAMGCQGEIATVVCCLSTCDSADCCVSRSLTTTPNTAAEATKTATNIIIIMMMIIMMMKVIMIVIILIY